MNEGASGCRSRCRTASRSCVSYPCGQMEARHIAIPGIRKSRELRHGKLHFFFHTLIVITALQLQNEYILFRVIRRTQQLSARVSTQF